VQLLEERLPRGRVRPAVRATERRVDERDPAELDRAGRGQRRADARTQGMPEDERAVESEVAGHGDGVGREVAGAVRVARLGEPASAQVHHDRADQVT
jgi:hypothetical protein